MIVKNRTVTTFSFTNYWRNSIVRVNVAGFILFVTFYHSFVNFILMLRQNSGILTP